MGWLLVLGLKEGLVECATLCIKSEVILNCGYSSDFLQLQNITQISNSILIRSSSNVMGNQGRNLFFRQECSEFLETVGGPYLMGPHHAESCAKNESTLGVTFFFLSLSLLINSHHLDTIFGNRRQVQYFITQYLKVGYSQKVFPCSKNNAKSLPLTVST